MVLYERQKMNKETFSDVDEAERCAESWINGNLSFVREWIRSDGHDIGFARKVIDAYVDLADVSLEVGWEAYDRLMMHDEPMTVEYTRIHSEADEGDADLRNVPSLVAKVGQDSPVGTMLRSMKTVIGVSERPNGETVTEMWTRVES